VRGLDSDFAPLTGPDPAAVALKQELAEIIMWSERNAPRSRQLSIGPSEVGHACDRRLAYRIAGAAPVNTEADPWPAIVGTSIHDWLEKAVNRYQSQVRDLGYLTELRVYPDAMVKGRSDLFNVTTGTVVDYKSAGTEVMRKIRKGEIPDAYQVQVQVYGLGHERAGRKVNSVALVFYPRSGWLDDAVVWLRPYDRSVALAALQRVYAIADLLIDFDIERNPHRFQLIEATPGDACVWCPYLLKESYVDTPASEKGCPGR
jgi:hypothetical protein